MKVLKCISIITLIVTLAACSREEYEIVPLEKPGIEEFTEFYVHEEYIRDQYLGSNYIIYKRTNIEAKAYHNLAYGLDDGYSIGAWHMDNYRVLFDDEYYDLQQGYQLRLYTAEDLIEYGVEGVTRSCSYSDTCE